MNRLSTQVIARTAVLLALTVVFQALGRYIPLGPNSNFIVGPLVNACLMVAAATVGIWGSSIIAVAAPFGALMTGAAVPLPFVPFVALGNLSIVLVFYFFYRRGNTIGNLAGVLLGSLVKFGVLFGSIVVFLRFANLPAKKASAMLLTFSWPQLVTALIGGALALAIIFLLPRNIKR